MTRNVDKHALDQDSLLSIAVMTKYHGRIFWILGILNKRYHKFALILELALRRVAMWEGSTEEVEAADHN
jgi:hypothetical protein